MTHSKSWFTASRIECHMNRMRILDNRRTHAGWGVWVCLRLLFACRCWCFSFEVKSDFLFDMCVNHLLVLPDFVFPELALRASRAVFISHISCDPNSAMNRAHNWRWSWGSGNLRIFWNTMVKRKNILAALRIKLVHACRIQIPKHRGRFSTSRTLSFRITSGTSCAFQTFFLTFLRVVKT
jgi:hypothetical protein